ncbi:uncharacterized protein LOC110403227 isoform X2 [Numida meleagris]|uniref:uncharacterized protein LOC110403227 isoform X2 n=1 Tax=Numida meleagris TaxID=8996 RepID=UPI000B3D8254|nr:uncharacterized protein LOC110403227 isoform X2 [Numida meleagris]
MSDTRGHAGWWPCLGLGWCDKCEVFSVRMPLKSVRPSVAVCPCARAVPEEPSGGCSPCRGRAGASAPVPLFALLRGGLCARRCSEAMCGEQRALLSWQRGETGNEEGEEKKPDPGVGGKKKKKKRQHQSTAPRHRHRGRAAGRIRAQLGRARSALVLAAHGGRGCPKRPATLWDPARPCRADGDGMSPALRLLLSLAGCTLLRGTPLPPRGVRLRAQNFHVQLRWEPDPRAPNGTTYQVEWRKRTSRWTRADTCGGNSSGSSWVCELHCDDIHGIYWARVRAVQDGEPSPWVSSSELLPYRDTIVGPPTLSWQLQGHNLSINLSAPLTPYRSRHGSYKPLSRVLRKLRYHLRLYHRGVLQQEVPCRWTTRRASCTFRFLMPSTQYCVRTVAVDIAPQRSQEAEQCLETPAGPAGFPWVLLAVLVAALPLLSVPAVCLTCVYAFPKPSETHLPKTLALLPGSAVVPTLELQEDAPAPLLPAPNEPPVPTAPKLLGEQHYQERSGYCPNGFGTEWHEGRAAPSSQPGSWVPAQQEDEEDESDGDAATVSPVSSVMDGDYGTSEAWLSPHLQLYSTALGVGSSLPPTLHTVSISPGELQESMARSWVPLSSVRLPGTELEMGDGDTQQQGCPCTLPPLLIWHMGTPHGQEAAASSEHPSAVLGAPEAEYEE